MRASARPLHPLQAAQASSGCVRTSLWWATMRARSASWAGIGSENTMGLAPGTGSRALGAPGALVTVLDAATAHFSD